MKKIKTFLLLLPLIFSSSCKEINSVFNPGTKEESKEEVKEETLSKEEIEDLIKKSEVFSREEMIRIFNLLIRDYFSKEEIIEMIKEALKDTYSTSEVDHMINSLEGERVVESWRQEESYYRIYSDGWIEQGGRVQVVECKTTTVNLFKTMKDTKFVVNVTNNCTHTKNNTEGVLTTTISSTANKIYVHAGYIDPNTTYAFWEVKGFMKIEENQEATENEN